MLMVNCFVIMYTNVQHLLIILDYDVKKMQLQFFYLNLKFVNWYTKF